MTIGLILITHAGIGQALIETVRNTFGSLPLPIESLSVGKDPDPDLLLQEALKAYQNLNQTSEVLILTDMMGSTPSNIAQKVQSHFKEAKVLAGLNLPMLFRIINYRTLPLRALIHKAVQGGREGIVLFSEMDKVSLRRRRPKPSNSSEPGCL